MLTGSLERVVTAEEMRWCDEQAERKYGIPSLVLMENAGASVARLLRKQFGPLAEKKIAVVCGKGNNGGDGFVAARHLLADGGTIAVYLTSSASSLRGDAKTNYWILKKLSRDSAHSLRVEKFSAAAATGFSPALVVDAVFGTGFGGVPHRPFKEAIEWMNGQGGAVTAVDIPSGINGSNGVAEGVHVNAALTVTLAASKIGCWCNQGADSAGELHVADIGIPSSILGAPRFKTFLLSSRAVHRVLPPRSRRAHKYSVGKVLVLAGSKNLTGAAAMCSTAALKAGAGAVVLGTPESVAPTLARKLTEVMVHPLPATADGSLSAASFEALGDRLAWADVLLVGPGLSRSAETSELVRRIVASYRGKILLDADGLNALGEVRGRVLSNVPGAIVLTPHVGEFARLTRIRSDRIERERVEIARAFAKTNRVTLLLKGVPTAVASEEGLVFLNPTGNPGMATAGSGDVLSGIIAGLWSQGMSPVDATAAGAYVHGLSGDLARDAVGEKSLVATDLIEYLAGALISLELEDRR